VLTQTSFTFTSGFSGQVMIEPYFFELYNMVMTNFPIIVFALFDF